MSVQRIENGKLVRFTYRITDAAGQILEHSDLPITYIHGAENDLIEKLEASLEGHAVGDSLEVAMEPEDAFGEHDDSLTFTDEIANVPEQFRYVGAEIEMNNEDGESRNFFVSRIEHGKLTVDGNHPFAGKIVTYHLQVIEVRDATPEDEPRQPPPQH